LVISLTQNYIIKCYTKASDFTAFYNMMKCAKQSDSDNNKTELKTQA